MSSSAKTQAEKRAERLAKALRANLGRRKSQARGRDAAPEHGAEVPESDAEKSQADSE
jgi:hypothetical protein